jgi:hypothetical protein
MTVPPRHPAPTIAPDGCDHVDRTPSGRGGRELVAEAAAGSAEED